MSELPLTPTANSTNGPAAPSTAGRVSRPGNAIEETLAGIYATCSGWSESGRRVVLRLGGDSISSMQVVRGHAPQAHVPAADVFVEQTVARLARVTAPAPTHRPCRRGSGRGGPTPIMRWLAAWTVRSTSSTKPCSCRPRRATEADVAALLQALLDRHAMLRAHADDPTPETGR
ncbi:linear gramicidin synthetase subunit D domain protein [Mycobacterium xenopi 4042]|uniref:Linear gramicidin synthetase subunit D domain protein n=1 Tax=Mycobacterium xenopi 4042 TaxID=1299334 RepID=X7ZNR5_MYCXE|nr:linear gramicidin synthetase subunit D domain protein [Mycobacterium xenopi 4042]